jgi:GNAT superfamily N-acetyltransferase
MADPHNILSCCANPSEFESHSQRAGDKMRKAMEGFGMTEESKIQLRLAVPEDVPVLRELIEASVWKLQAEDYTPAQMEGALKTVFGVDSQLIADGTYIVAEAYAPKGGRDARSSANSPRVIVGCGGWSKRKTLFGGDRWTEREDSLLNPLHDAAKIRAFFIHPDWARRGIGSLILKACEDAASAAGFKRYEMGATLTGAKLFGSRGYVPVKPISIPLVNGETLPVIHMEKKA